MVQSSSPNLSTHKPVCFIVGGPDVDFRLELMQKLCDEFEFIVAGSKISLQDRFYQAGYTYWPYRLDRGINPLHDLQMVFDLRRLFRKIRPSIVHTFDTKPGVFARLSARLAGVPVIIATLPGLGSLFSENDFRTRLIRCIYQPLQSLACHLSDLTIFQNPDDAHLFIHNGMVSEDKTAIISGSGVDTRLFDPQRFRREQSGQIRVSLGLDESKVVVMMISRLIRPKGVLEFARAAQAVQWRYPQVSFLLIGSDDRESRDALTQIEREEISDSVRWLGVRNDIPELLAISDIFVLPSKYREGIPRVLMEAAAMGLPLITTDMPGCREVVKHDVNGFTVPCEDAPSLAKAIASLVQDENLRKRFGQKSRQIAIDRFSLAEVARQTASIYSKLLNSRQKVK